MRGTTDIICILALVSVVSTVQKCNNNSDVQAFRLIRKLGTAQLRFVTNLEGDMGTCRTTRRRNLYPESQSAVFRIRILQADEEDYTEFIETAKVTECPSTLEICVKDEPCNCYLRQGVYSDYQNCLIDRDPSFKPGDPQGCRLFALNGAEEDEIEECKTHLGDCGVPTNVYDDTTCEDDY